MGKTIRTWILMGIIGASGTLALGTGTAQAAHHGHRGGGHHARRFYNYNRGHHRFNYGVRRFGYGGYGYGGYGTRVVPFGTYRNFGFMNGFGYPGYGMRRFW